ncbi:MAG: NADH dehydrogenase (quinone) subunit D [Planctomycetota bacterium]
MIEPAVEPVTLNFGPQHPATHGTLHFEMQLDGETIVKVTPNLGYLHTGMEKIGEARTYNQFVVVTDRMNYLSALSNNIAYSQAVEELLHIEIPERTRVIRVILSELSRISDHIVCLGLSAMDLGAFSAFLYSFANRERLYDVFEEVTGGRLTTSYTRVGGLANDLPEGFDRRVRKALHDISKALNELEELLTGNRIWQQRTQGVGVITAENALKFGCTGPIIRACGIPYDVRRAKPYLGYDKYQWDVVTHEGGDVWARYMVRKGEVAQSLRIIEQAIDSMPVGDINALKGKITLPDKVEVFGSIEGLIHHFKLIMDGHGHKPTGEVYNSSEAPNGELGYYIVADGTAKPLRIRVRPPSLYHYQAFPHMVEGKLVADAVATLSSLNIIAGELDR